MLHRCGHSSGGSAPPCSCGFLHGACGGGGASFSILFPMSGKQHMEGIADDSSSYTTPSSVDCTLSLGTPSTRQTAHKPSSTPIHRSMPGLCWDIISQSGKHASRGTSTASGAGAGSTSSNLGGDPLLLARRCANCDTTSTPLWRNGPRGPKSLCNACGIRYKKEERRAAASSPSPSSSSSVATAAAGYSYQWAPQQLRSCYTPAATAPAPKSPSISMYDEFRVMASNDDADDDDDRDGPYLSWRLNVVPPPQFPVTDRPSLFQYQ